MARRRDKEYDEDERRHRSEAEKEGGGGGNILLVLGLVFGGIVLVCGGAGAYFVYRVSKAGGDLVGQVQEGLEKQAEEQRRHAERMATTDQGKAKAFLISWVGQLRIRNDAEAYRQTSSAYQARVSRDGFDRFLGQNPALRRDSSGWSHGIDPRPGDRFMFLWSPPQIGAPRAPYSFTVVRERGEWRVDDVD